MPLRNSIPTVFGDKIRPNFNVNKFGQTDAKEEIKRIQEWYRLQENEEREE